MVRKYFTVIAYDIRSNSRRAKVAAVLEFHGRRVNKSVFECMLSERQHTRVSKEIAKLIQPKHDTVLFYRVCASCFEACFCLGKPPGEADVNAIV